MQTVYHGEPDASPGPGQAGFCEVDDEGKASEHAPLYIPFEFGRIDISCDNLFLRQDTPCFIGKNAENHDSDCAELFRTFNDTPVLMATGHIQKSRYGRFSLSFFGHSQTYETISVSVFRTEKIADQGVYFAGIKPRNDLDFDREGGFFLQVNLSSKKFDTLTKQLFAPDVKLHASIEVRRFPGFYATWSPSVSEGRVIKFLDNEKDISNLNEVPDQFISSHRRHAEIYKDDPNPPAHLSVERRLGHTNPQTFKEDGDDLEYLHDEPEKNDAYQTPTREDWIGFMFRTEAMLSAVSRSIGWLTIVAIALLIATLLPPILT